MSIAGGPDIVENGLVLHLDAADRNSYPGTGTAWYDLSGNGNHVTLTNGPTYNSSNGGSILFDGTNDYAITDASLNLSSYSVVTVEIILKTLNTTTTSMTWEHSANWNTNGGGFGLACNSNGTADLSGVWHQGGQAGARNFLFSQGNSSFSTQSVILSMTNGDTTGRLCYANGNLLSFTSLYNGYSSSTTSSGGSFSNYKMYFGSRGGSSLFLNGNISIFRLYNRKLTASEILQNYNATKGRFSL